MACRCTDIEKLEAEIGRLNDILGKLHAMSIMDISVQSSLNVAGAACTNCFISRDDNQVEPRMKHLNNKVTSSIDSMELRIDPVLADLEEQLSDAKDEDFWYHLNPMHWF